METLSIDNLKAGMYVVDVVETKGSFKVKTKGWVKSEAAIRQLKAKGILTVAIDPSKTIEQAQTKEEPTEPKQKIKHTTFEHEIQRADRLYNEAKNLQQKAFEDIAAGRAIDVEPVKEITKNCIDSIFRNQDALACMTRIREKDQYLMEHSLNVSILMSIFAKHLQLEPQLIQDLATGAFLHDIGKVKIPDEILNKPGKLTPEEFEVIKTHATHSLEILQNTQGLSAVSVQVAAEHHEKLNGTGYPKGLKGDEISQWGKMITIVDIYDAMTADRVYKKGMTPAAAFKFMKNMVPDELDEKLLNSFIQCVGIHPVGTVVKLTSGKLAIVTKSNKLNPLKPRVKVFYHAKHQHYTEPKDLDLAKIENDAIEASVKPEQFKVDLNKFFREAFVM
ncbi:phosphodiesterase [Saccharobesus litoralis]|uniref:Phosphodiesterase n=1 Tax=Saccharobesus litoralis TaxID=2172099 RepID=A0A2S0VXY4_9ALTE|nr:HD-GYP domain-containing protein [Saccharobesus litoralis]AWB69087.1 phosphodiesterase [Saccharobesus litoralis]